MRNDRATTTAIGSTTTTVVVMATAPTSNRWRAVRVVRKRTLDRSCTGRAARRCTRADHAIAAPTTSNCSTASAQAMRRSNACVARRQISTSSVGWAGPASTLAMPKEVKQNRNTIDPAATTDGRSEGQHDLAEAPPRRRAQRRRGLLQRRVELGEERAHRAHHDGQVDPHVGDQHRLHGAPHRVGQQTPGRPHRRRWSAARTARSPAPAGRAAPGNR